MKGRLPNNSTFFNYPFLIIFDNVGVSSKIGWTVSVGGFYLSPVCLPPSNVSSTQSLQNITNDFVNGMTRVIRATDHKREYIRALFDFLGFLAIYKEAGRLLYVMGHGAIRPCTVCNFRRKENVDSWSPRYAHKTQKTLNYDAMLIEMSLYENLRSWRILWTSCVCRKLETALFIQPRFKHFTHTPLSQCFRSFPSSIAAPDHCINGYFINVINTLYSCLPETRHKLVLNALFCEAMRGKNLRTDSNI